jgi:hypothetical protein
MYCRKERIEEELNAGIGKSSEINLPLCTSITEALRPSYRTSGLRATLNSQLKPREPLLTQSAALLTVQVPRESPVLWRTLQEGLFQVVLPGCYTTSYFTPGLKAAAILSRHFCLT